MIAKFLRWIRLKPHGEAVIAPFFYFLYTRKWWIREMQRRNGANFGDGLCCKCRLTEGMPSGVYFRGRFVRWDGVVLF